MILVCVGTQFGFDRLIKEIDDWAHVHPNVSIVAQIGETIYQPKNLQWHRYLPNNEFDGLLSRAELVISHAGMGTIITCLLNSIPILLLPRKAELKEHRNNHQISTAEKFRSTPGVFVADDVEALRDLLEDRALLHPSPYQPDSLQDLISNLRNYFNDNNPTA